MKKLIIAFLPVIMLFNITGIMVSATNNSKNNAIVIDSYDEKYYNTISVDEEVDLYKLTTDSDDAYYYFLLHNESASGYLGLKVYNNRDEELFNIYASRGQSCSTDIKLAPDMTYYIQIYGDYNVLGNYSISVSKQIDVIPNLQKNAVSIDKNKMYYQSIDGKGDIDWYVINSSSQSEYYNFYLKNESGTTNAHLVVYNERDEELLDLGNYTGAGQDITGSIKIDPKFKYYFKVYFDDDGRGNYSFKITSVFDEDGNNKHDATEIELNQEINSSIDGVQDVDYFVLKTESLSGEYKLIYNDKSGNTESQVILYTERDEELLNVSCNTSGQQAEGQVTLNANSTYYVKVFFRDNNTGSYSFKISQCIDGHKSADAWLTIVEPTCFKNGEKIQKCAVCEEVVEVKEIAALGHSFSNEEVIKPATIVSLGEKKIVCSRCGEVTYLKDWSKVWILPTIIVVVILALIGIISYIRVFIKSRS